jgi:hypothetical protein
VAEKRKPSVPRLALSPGEAAEAIGCSRDFFHEHVRPDLRVVLKGQRVFISVAEIERWLDKNAARYEEAA